MVSVFSIPQCPGSQTVQCCSFVFTCARVTSLVRGAMLLCYFMNPNAITSRRNAASTTVFKWKLFPAATFINTTNLFTLEWARFARSGNHAVILTKDDFCTFPQRFLCQRAFPPLSQQTQKKKQKTSTIKGARSDNVCHWLCGPLSLFCSLYLPCGVQDVKGWPTRSSMCLGRAATARGIRARVRGDRLSHPDAANLLPASHVNRYAIVWSAACSAWTEPPPRR